MQDILNKKPRRNSLDGPLRHQLGDYIRANGEMFNSWESAMAHFSALMKHPVTEANIRRCARNVRIHCNSFVKVQRKRILKPNKPSRIQALELNVSSLETRLNSVVELVEGLFNRQGEIEARFDTISAIVETTRKFQARVE